MTMKVLCSLTISFFLTMFIIPRGMAQDEKNAAAGLEKKISNSQKMEFAYLSPGTFMMGSSPKERNREDDEKQHKVTLTKGFYMQTTETTVGQWRAFVKDTGFKSDAEKSKEAWIWTGIEWKGTKGVYWNKPNFNQTDQHPVTCVSWKDVSAFTKWLSKKEGKTYRLPTEAEWEYACRAGTDTPFNTGKCISADQANYDGRYPYSGCPKSSRSKSTAPVAGFSPNPRGLYDMHGNVWEWCRDLYSEDAYRKHSPKDPVYEKKGYPERVYRGGSWVSYGRYCRSANRNWDVPNLGYFDLGFRLVMIP